MIKVIINGANGKMGSEAVKAVTNDSHCECVAEVDTHLSLQETLNSIDADVVVDLTHPDSVFTNVKLILESNCHAVVGTTGLSPEQIKTLGDLATKQKKAFILCPNFAISAILMMRFAEEAAKVMERCEIIEYHHNQKADAPSGTAINTAERIHKQAPNINKTPLNETQVMPGSRGVEHLNIPIHAIRLPGVVANQEVIFGAQGQTLTIRHDTISREAFMPGLLIAIKSTSSQIGLIYGLEHLI